jgi:hypothetical protein
VHLTIRTSLQTIWLALWDEERQRLVTFYEALQTQRFAPTLASNRLSYEDQTGQP